MAEATMRAVRRFGTDDRGAVAAIFGLALVPLMAAVGGAVDYSRAASFHSRAQLAVDAAALAIVREPTTATAGDIQSKGRDFVLAALGSTLGPNRTVTLDAVTTTRVGNTVTVSVGGTMKTAVMSAIGVTTMPISATSRATFGNPGSPGRIELALVLDNTGSMADTIGGRRKIDELQSAAKGLLSKLRSLADTDDKVKVSVVPFDTEVRLDAAATRNQPWFLWNDEATDKPRWTGYVQDRYGSYAVSDAAPSGAIHDSLYPAPRDSEYRTNRDLARLSSADLAPLHPLTSLYDQAKYNALDAAIGSMKPRGYTNIALGVNWGLATLSSGAPFTEGSPKGTANVRKIMIVLTDGDNTMNHVNGRLSTDVSRIDANTSAACTMTKNEGIDVYTIRLLDGNETLLRNCASNPDNYFDVQRAGELANVLDVILNAVVATRLTH